MRPRWRDTIATIAAPFLWITGVVRIAIAWARYLREVKKMNRRGDK